MKNAQELADKYVSTHYTHADAGVQAKIRNAFTVGFYANEFKMPTDKQLIDFAILFAVDEDNKIDKQQLADMVGMCNMILDRLFENGDVMIKSSKEN